MTNSKEVLSAILKTTQMGQVGIRSILDTSMSPGIRKVLQSQLEEYSCIETQAHHLATQRGWELQELQPGTRFWTDRMIRMKLGFGNKESQIADLLIQRSTQGIITGRKMSNRWTTQDNQISILSQKLLDCENANIRRLQNFL